MFDVADPGGDRRADHRARDGQGAAQGRAREVLRRRHLPQAEAAREAEEGQEADEAGRRRRGAAGGVPGRAQPRTSAAKNEPCDAPPLRPPALLRPPLRLLRLRHRRRPRRRARRLRRRAARGARARARAARAERRDVFLGGGTPTFTEPARARAAARGLPPRGETTVEANPETVTPELAALLRENGVDRVSLGAQSFQPHLLGRLERRARPDDVRARRPHALRDAGFDNVSLDLIYGIPGQSAADLDARSRRGDRARAGAPLLLRARGEAGNALHACARRRARAAGGRDGGLLRAGRRDADRGRLPLVRDGELLPRRRATAATCARGTTSATGSATTTSASGSAPSRPSRACAGGTRRACRATSRRSRRGERPQREVEPLDERDAARERLMLGLRLDEPLPLAASTPRSTARRCPARAARARRGATGGHARADAPRPLPRRRRHRRAAGLNQLDFPGKWRARSGSPTAKREILRRVVEEYVATGSRWARRRWSSARGCGVSSSTVRNELAELEALGLLTHPHTSAGRIPTEAGYRFYAEEVLERQEPRPARSRSTSLDAERDRGRAPGDDRDAAQVTRLLALVSAPALETASVRHVEVLLLQPKRRDGRRDHLDRRRHQEAVRVRPSRSTRPRGMGERVPERAARRRRNRHPQLRRARSTTPGLPRASAIRRRAPAGVHRAAADGPVAVRRRRRRRCSTTSVRTSWRPTAGCSRCSSSAPRCSS